ncbi:hypothetical protein [Hanstruepera ponticola]|uniref:hypothetical protein n=1 Tax=Hanstruepera ponticola TaxID=2042995 RepID=UPI000CF14999|nr:hypothetical protein [Hanstruepera ponticola]
MKAIKLKVFSTLILILLVGFGTVSSQNNNEVLKIDKKKAKVLMSMSEMACNELNSFNFKELNDKLIQDTYVKILSENHKKINKYYDTFSEDGLNSFIFDLTETLISNCKLVREFINKKID